MPQWLEDVRAGRPMRMVDFEFLEAVFAAQTKVNAYNATTFTSVETMSAALRDLFGSIGTDAVVLAPVWVDVGFNIEIGDGSFINANVTLLDTYPIRIGRDVMIGPNCALYPVGHPLRAADRFVRDEQGRRTGHFATGAPIVIEDEVWLGGNVIVMPGVTIGARSTIGAGSVVTKSVPPDVFAAGNPCRVIRQL